MSKRIIKWNIEGYRVFLKDTEQLKIKVAYNRLKHKLSLRENRMSHEAILQALDSSSDDCVLAGDLYLIAKDEAEKFELYYEMEVSKLVSEAQEVFEKKKRAKKLSSQITKELKMSWVYENRRTIIEYLERKKRELNVIKSRMEILKDAWKFRVTGIQSQARAVEQNRIIRLGKVKDGNE